MDVFNNKPPKVIVKQKSFIGEAILKSDLVTLEKQNAALPKTKTRPTSKYMSGTTQSAAYRSSSPSFIRASAIPGTSVPKRAQSAERKRPNTTSLKSSSPSSPTARRSAPTSPLSRPTVTSPPTSKPSTPPSSVSSRSTTPVRDTIVDKQNTSRREFGGQTTDGLWTSMRSLSSSFQSESFVRASKKDMQVRSTSLDHTLKNSSTAVSERKRTPLTGRNTSEQSENSNPVQGAYSRVVDQHRWPAMKGGKVSTMAFSRSIDLTDKIGKAASLMLQSRGLSPTRRIPASDGISKSIHKSSNEVAQQTSLEAYAKVDHSMNYGFNMISPHVDKEKLMPSTNPSRTSSLLMVSLRHPSSPNNDLVISSSASKRTPSPSSTRPSSPLFSSNNTSQIGTSSTDLNRILDIRKRMKGADMEDIHQLRMLYNRELQWRFVNSQADVALATQEIAAENIFNNVWNVTSELQDSVTIEKINIGSQKQEMKLGMLLKEQASFLEDWIALEGEYSASLFGTIEALKASTLRLPVTSGARVDIRAVKNAVSSAIDIMQAMGSSVCYLLSRAEGTKRLFCQLSAVAAKEKAMLDECKVLLAATAGMQVEECSLRAHILQQFRQDIIPAMEEKHI